MIKLFIWSSVGNYTFFTINILYRIIFSRWLSPEAFGDYAFALSIVDIFLIFNLFRFTVCIVQFPHLLGIEKKIRKLLAFQIAFSYITGIGIVLYLYLANHQITVVVFTMMYIFSSVLNINKSYYQAILERELQYKKYGIMLSMVSVLSLILTLIIYFIFKTNYIIGIKDLILASLSIGGFYIISRGYEVNAEVKINYKAIVSVGIWVFLQSHAINILNKLDIFFIGIDSTNEFVGYYSQARFLSQNILNFAFLLFQPLFAVYSNLFNENHKLCRDYFIAVSAILSYFIVFIIIIFFFLSPIVIIILLGNNWMIIENLFKAIIFIIYPSTMLYNTSLFLHASGKLKIATIIIIIISILFFLCLGFFHQEYAYEEKIYFYYFFSFVLLASLIIISEISFKDIILIFSPVLNLLLLITDSKLIIPILLASMVFFIFLYNRFNFFSLLRYRSNKEAKC